jgi:hypothetical protein
LNGETDQIFRCRTCANLRSEHGKKYCDWLESYLERTALSSCYCEGYVCKESGAKQKRGDKSVGNDAGQATQDLEVTCPKTTSQPEKTAILAALELKRLKGSVIMERVNCGKPRCHKCQSGGKHGPYLYLHYYSSGKVKRRYLSKRMAQLLRCSREELEKLLSEVESSCERVLGQETSSGVI